MPVLVGVPILVCVGLLVNGVRLRGRLRRLDTLPASGRPVDPAHEFLVAAGVRLSEAARRAASNHARRERLDVLDLVPADLTVERALDVARMVDTRTYRADRAAPGRGAFQALLVHTDLLARIGVTRREGFDPVELVDILTTLKRYAPTSTDLAVLPGLRAARDDVATRIRVQQRAYRFQPQKLLFPFAPQVGTFIGFQVIPPIALVAMLLFWFQPFFVCAGRVPLAPRDLIRSPIARILGFVLFVVDSVRAGRRQAQLAAEAKAAGRPADPAKEETRRRAHDAWETYQADVAGGIERFCEPELSACPWCGSAEIGTRIRSSDLLMGKPGRFRLDACERCGHLFANPPLTGQGQDYYERDWRDGLSADAAEHAAARDASADRARAELVRPFTTPRAWLDVGCGYGHFCNTARSVWPATYFGGLDLVDGVAAAYERGWIEVGYRGEFVDLADEVAGDYDVISMVRYLERTRAPSEELDAVAKALAPGGYLLVEMPNAAGMSARLFGRLWPGWGMPRTQHLIPVDNLVAALEDRGMRCVRVQFGPAYRPGDAVRAVGLFAQALAPAPAPWVPGTHPPGAGRRLGRGLVLLAAGVPFVLAWLVDRIGRRILVSGERSNAYRVLARMDG